MRLPLVMRESRERILGDSLYIKISLTEVSVKKGADREVKRSNDAGNDADDAKDALESNKDFFKTQYQDIVKNA